MFKVCVFMTFLYARSREGGEIIFFFQREVVDTLFERFVFCVDLVRV